MSMSGLQDYGARATKAIGLIRLIQFAHPGQFSDMAHLSEYLLADDPDHPGYSTPHMDDIAKALDQGYRKNPGWFEDVLNPPTISIWNDRKGMSALASAAQRDMPESPFTLLFGVDSSVVDGCRMRGFEDIAGLARIALSGIGPELLWTAKRYFQAADAPSVDELRSPAFATRRLGEVYSEFIPLAELLECDEVTKFTIFRDLDARGLAQMPVAVGAVCVQAALAGVPLHRVLQAWALCRDADAALVLWDAPADYLLAVAGGEA